MSLLGNTNGLGNYGSFGETHRRGATAPKEADEATVKTASSKIGRVAEIGRWAENLLDTIHAAKGGMSLNNNYTQIK